MKSDALAQFPHIWLTILGLLIFLAIFLGWTRWAFNPKRKEHLDDLSRLPLED